MIVHGEFAEGCQPEYATLGSAGADLRANIEVPTEIPPGQSVQIPTGVRLEIPSGYEGQVRPRSGLAAKHGVTVLNAPGTIDSDYRGEIRVILVNFSDKTYVMNPGDRVAQLVIGAVTRVEFNPTAIRETERGEGGFGSTGR